MIPPETIGKHVFISGTVQGVWYRASLVQVAQEKQLAGWCRNREDGRVEAVLAGPAETVEAVMLWCRQGPPLAKVSGIHVTDVDASGLPVPFEVRPTA